MTQVDLGFIEACEEHDSLLNIHFPSKVGGRPAWLNLETVPSADQLKCPLCQGQCTFLMQLYASLETDEAFHRTLYVFVCPNEACNRPNSAANFKVFRNQIPRRNPFYDYHPVPEDAQVAEARHKFKLCSVCGCRGPFDCAQCKRISYCSKSHQTIDWRAGHKEQCGKEKPETVAGKGSSLVQLPEFEVVLEQERREDREQAPKEDSDERLQREMAELRRIEADGTATMQEISGAELSRFAGDQEEDKFFSNFRKRIAGEPEQVLRYDRTGEPLWMAEANRLASVDVPNCDHCQGERVFEFQLMPQLLNSLKSDTLDWGVLAVYTCKQSCGAEGKYLAEFLHKQDIEDRAAVAEEDEDDDE